MYLYYDRTGKLKEIINDDALRQGNYDINKVYLYIDREDISSIDVSYLLPSGLIVGPANYSTTETTTIPYDAKRDLFFFKYYTSYTFIVIDLEEDTNGNGPLDEAGLVHTSLEAQLTGGSQLSLGDLNFNVEENAVLNQNYVASQEYLSLSNYLFLRSLLNQRSSSSLKVIDYFQTKAELGELPEDEFGVGMVVFDYEEEAFYYITSVTQSTLGFVSAEYYNVLTMASYATYEQLQGRLEKDDTSWFRIEYNFVSKASNGTLDATKYFENVIVYDPSAKTLYQVTSIVDNDEDTVGATYLINLNEANYQSTYASNPLRWDTTPTASSTKPVTSGGIKTSLDSKVNYQSVLFMRVIPNFTTQTGLTINEVVQGCVVFDPLALKFYLVTQVVYDSAGNVLNIHYNELSL